ncbi:CAZyme family AA9 [Aspergillus niger]|uniref:Auxiliary Activity family 9 catalytic domain-containing protein n=1 Tax=Aspergillus niger TaxID=5061 RepID=A0A3F3RY90_ASPNG|nr:CAZyme family AA9 [Aspergillus niger]KAI2844910.1 CAZyme family AA9 [Aspergillus niger]KAI2900405.1 CAZyme family AA9 [Aspergillus niger]KAI2913839.1 CAZyme family AA9 [Aspergillus niger]KAI2962314.1 CAZyme family AA9 [Aspergillus niger]
MSVAKIAGVVLGSAALVAGHGYVSGAVIDGEYYGGYIVSSYAYESDPPETIAWSTTATDLGFVDGSEYSDPDIICHKSAKPGAISADVKAGGTVELQWTDWPSSHHGPVLTYLANCNGDCSDVTKTDLEFFKIDESGLISDTEVPGTWATDNLISNNNSWTVTIPSTLEAGNYVLRHEIIALHSAENKDGAQNYPQCLNLKVTGSGSSTYSGTKGEALYKDTDPGILVNIYETLSSYDIPGPAMYNATSSSSSSGSSSGASSTSSAAAAAATTSSASTSSASTPTTSAAAATSSAVSATTTAAAAVVTDVETTVQTAVATAYQTSTDVVQVTVTGSAPQQTHIQVASSSAAASTPSSSSVAVSSDNLTSYFSSLSADQFLSVLKETFSWLVTEKKHARDLNA